MGKLRAKEPRTLTWSYPDKRGVLVEHFMGTLNTTGMDRYFDNRYFEEKLYGLYDCKTLEELLKYLARETCLYVNGVDDVDDFDDVPEDIIEDILEGEIPELREKVFDEVDRIRELCFNEYRWKSFEKKYTTPQQIFDQYTDMSYDSYDWYVSGYSSEKQVKIILDGRYFTVYETYVAYMRYTSLSVAKFLVIVPTIKVC